LSCVETHDGQVNHLTAVIQAELEPFVLSKVFRNSVRSSSIVGCVVVVVRSLTNEATSNATLYFSSSHNRWVLEAPDIYFEANTTHHSIGQGTDDHNNAANDRRRPHGISEYFGKNKWFQFSLNYGSQMVDLAIVCFDTRQPTLAPSVSPTTPSPTMAPTEICEAITVTVSGGVTTYNGIYNKQSSTINGYDWWVARNDVGFKVNIRSFDDPSVV
jgi:hypothetical protein